MDAVNAQASPGADSLFVVMAIPDLYVLENSQRVEPEPQWRSTRSPGTKAIESLLCP
jgi:hypothetical protein